MAHLKTSAYRPQTDAKCERVHFSVHNMITKLVGDCHQRWPDLLGTVALAYNATVHTSTGYSPHELFYSFAPACPLDALVSTPLPAPASNADEYALQAVERLQEAANFVRNYTGRQVQRMKKRYDATVRPKLFEENQEVLLFNPRKKRGQYSKWQVTWSGPFTVKRRLNDCNYVLQKSARSRPFVVHVDRMRECNLQEPADSSADKPPVSDTPSTTDRLSQLSSRVLRGRTNANTPVEPTITDQTEKARATVRPVDSPMSISADRALATDATDTPARGVIDSITDTDTAVAGMSGTRPASSSEANKRSLCSDTTGSNIRIRPARGDGDVAGAQDLLVSGDVQTKLPPLGQSARRGYAVSLLGCWTRLARDRLRKVVVSLFELNRHLVRT